MTALSIGALDPTCAAADGRRSPFGHLAGVALSVEARCGAERRRRHVHPRRRRRMHGHSHSHHPRIEHGFDLSHPRLSPSNHSPLRSSPLLSSPRSSQFFLKIFTAKMWEPFTQAPELSVSDAPSVIDMQIAWPYISGAVVAALHVTMLGSWCWGLVPDGAPAPEGWVD